MVRKSALVLGMLVAAWFAVDVTAPSAEACGGCGGCRTRCCRPRCCSPCYSTCYSGCYAAPACGSCGSYCATAYYAAPVYAAPACSTCATGYAVPGAYGYVTQAPVYGPSYVLSRAGVPSLTYTSRAAYPSYAVPVTAYRSTNLLRTSYAAPTVR